MIDDFRPVRKPRPRKIAPTTPSQPIAGFPPVEQQLQQANQVAFQSQPVIQQFQPYEPIAAEVPAEQPNSDSESTRRWYKNKKIWAAFISVVLLASFGAGTWFLFLKENTPEPPPVTNTSSVAEEKPAPTTLASPLTGVQVEPALTKRPVTAIMIENSPDARPQSGLRDAGVVFEAIAEGGITRFLTLFQESQPQYIGPVRSIRPYYLDWLAPFDAPVAHVGGSKDALDTVRSKSNGFRDLDQFFNEKSYQRITERYAPHNVYTSFAKLDALNASKGNTSSTFTGWDRKDEQKLTTPTAKSIDFKISSFYFNAHYDYDVATNTYLRSEGGKAHVDITSAKDKAPKQLAPKVVIAIVVPFGTVKANDGIRSEYTTTGSGRAFVFQDGGMIEGTWTKKNQKSQIVFTATDGKTIKLNSGQTWISVVSNSSEVSYKP